MSVFANVVVVDMETLMAIVTVLALGLGLVVAAIVVMIWGDRRHEAVAKQLSDVNVRLLELERAFFRSVAPLEVRGALCDEDDDPSAATDVVGGLRE